MLEALPTINATMNALCAAFLAAGYVAIRTGRRSLHWKLMAAAFAASTLFLVGYLTRVALTGTHAFPGTGWVKGLYLAILFSHMLLAAAVVPLALRTLWLSVVKKSYGQHKRIARWTLPIWGYVSVTGVVVYWMLYRMGA